MGRIVNRIKSFSDTRYLREWVVSKLTRFYSDKKYLSIRYKLRFGKDIDFDNPKTFNEKLNWLKLYYRNPLFTLMADKYWVKKYVAEKIGSEYVVPCYGRWNKFEDIDFSKLPDKCFMKSNQDSGGGVLYEKEKSNITDIKNRFSSKQIKKKNWYWYLREWVYKHIEPCILAEEYLDEGTGRELHDYKFWCFNGKPIYMYITNKGAVIKENFYDMDFNPVYIDHGFERQTPEYSKPAQFELMRELAEKLSKDIPFVRIDFFNVNGKVYFGEFTFYDWGAFSPFKDDWDLKLGRLINLPQY